MGMGVGVGVRGEMVRVVVVVVVGGEEMAGVVGVGVGVRMLLEASGALAVGVGVGVGISFSIAGISLSVGTSPPIAGTLSVGISFPTAGTLGAAASLAAAPSFPFLRATRTEPMERGRSFIDEFLKLEPVGSPRMMGECKFQRMWIWRDVERWSSYRNKTCWEGREGKAREGVSWIWSWGTHVHCCVNAIVPFVVIASLIPHRTTLDSVNVFVLRT